MSPVSFAIAIPEHVPKPEACELEEIRWQRFLDERAAEGTKLPEDLVRGLYAYIWVSIAKRLDPRFEAADI